MKRSSLLPLLIVLASLALTASGAYTWDTCGTKLDRLKTSKLSVKGSLTAGSKVTVTASGATDLHVPLESGAWQIRVYEDGVAKETHTEFGDLMAALKFDDAKNTTFTVTVSFTLPKKQASGRFDANLVATDQSKADYMCLDVKYAYALDTMVLSAAPAPPACFHLEDAEDHKCFEACADHDFSIQNINASGTCPSKYDTVDTSKTVLQCPDGVTNVRYCTSTAMNVTVTTKGESKSMVEALAAPTAYVHMIEHSPGDHCLEVSYGSKDSPFWKSDGWKYSAPVRPEWTDGACDRVKWKSKDSSQQDYDTWTATKNSPYGSVIFTKYGYK